MNRLNIFLVTLLLSASAMAIDTGVAFEDPEMQARYENLIDDIRCLVCQNQTIKDSNVFLASDLRREIRRMMSEGMTDAEIAQRPDLDSLDCTGIVRIVWGVHAGQDRA